MLSASKTTLVRKFIITGSVSGAILLGSFIASARAADVDITGEWKGTTLCDGLVNNTYQKFEEQATIKIKRTSYFDFQLQYISVKDGTVYYYGTTQQATGGNLEGMAVSCGGAYQSNEVMRMRPIALSGKTGYFDGVSNYFSRSGGKDFETCKYSFERVSTTPPVFNSCGQPK